MKFAIVYSSKTGNTAKLSCAVAGVLPSNMTVYSGAPDPAALEADMVYAGFWTDKGQPDPDSIAFLESLKGKLVFLFGTCGFGGDSEYQDRIMQHALDHLDDSNTVLGTFMCQGRIPEAVRDRYEGMLKENPDDAHAREMLDNFEAALRHPNGDDMHQGALASHAAFTKALELQ